MAERRKIQVGPFRVPPSLEPGGRAISSRDDLVKRARRCGKMLVPGAPREATNPDEVVRRLPRPARPNPVHLRPPLALHPGRDDDEDD
jgi:hypothetical protein